MLASYSPTTVPLEGSNTTIMSCCQTLAITLGPAGVLTHSNSLILFMRFPKLSVTEIVLSISNVSVFEKKHWKFHLT